MENTDRYKLLRQAYKKEMEAVIPEACMDEPQHEEANPMIADCEHSVNVGEIFVYPEYRGSGLSQQLLQFAENQAYQCGARYMWVEHGTANPEARAFWNRYFPTYQYELV